MQRSITKYFFEEDSVKKPGHFRKHWMKYGAGAVALFNIANTGLTLKNNLEIRKSLDALKKENLKYPVPASSSTV